MYTLKTIIYFIAYAIVGLLIAQLIKDNSSGGITIHYLNSEQSIFLSVFDMASSNLIGMVMLVFATMFMSDKDSSLPVAILTYILIIVGMVLTFVPIMIYVVGIYLALYLITEGLSVAVAGTLFFCALTVLHAGLLNILIKAAQGNRTGSVYVC